MNRLIAFAALLLSTPALAHHPLAGQKMTTFGHGLLSGVGHPVLGFDHLFFVIALGVAAAYTGRALLAPLAYLATMLLGCALSAYDLAPRGVEPLIALSLLVLGYVVLSGRALGLYPALGLFAAAGLFHGAAFGESMASAEAGARTVVLGGYLLGLALTQYAICLAAGCTLVKVLDAARASAVPARLAGAAVAGAGLLLTLEHIEAAVFSAAGIG